MSKCNRALYTYLSEYTLDSRFRSKTVTGVVGGISGISRVSFPDERPIRALFNATMGPYGVTGVINYTILDTDYDNYSFVVDCFNVNQTHSSESYWLYGRSYPLPKVARKRADKLIERYMDATKIHTVVQGSPDCDLEWTFD